VSWAAAIVDDVPGELLRWRSTGVGEVRTQGEVRFEAAPGERGTEVHLELRYAPPEGSRGRLAAFLSEAAARELEADLRRCKQLLETGHVVHADGIPRRAAPEIADEIAAKAPHGAAS